MITGLTKAIFIVGIFVFVITTYNKVKEIRYQAKLRKEVEDALKKHKHPESKATFPDDARFS